jgi:hypothetical protein
MNVTRWCSGCAADTAFDTFDCAEHPEDCVELVCVGCGEGFELPPVQVVPVQVVPVPAERRVTPAA